MKSFVQAGDVVPLPAPVGGVLSGAPVLIGALFVVPVTDAPEAATFQGKTRGVFILPKAAGTAWAQGDALFWDPTAKTLTKTAAGNVRAAVATAPAAAGATVGQALLRNPAGPV